MLRVLDTLHRNTFAKRKIRTEDMVGSSQSSTDPCHLDTVEVRLDSTFRGLQCQVSTCVTQVVTHIVTTEDVTDVATTQAVTVVATTEAVLDTVATEAVSDTVSTEAVTIETLGHIKESHLRANCPRLAASLSPLANI